MAQDGPAPMEQRIDRLESRAAIAELIHGYARCIRYDQPDRVAGLFTPEAVFEIRDGEPDRPDHEVRGRLEGREAIHAYLAPGKGKSHPIPLIHNLAIEVDGDTASATSVMEAQIYGGAHRVFGEYRDGFRRVDGRWYFASRIYTIFRGASSV